MFLGDFVEAFLLLLLVPFLFGDLFSNSDEDDPAPDILGSEGDDTLDGTTEPEEIYGGAGDDGIAAWSGDDTVEAGEGDDFVLAEDGDDLVFGGAGDDLVDGGSGNDTIWLGEGDDETADDGVSPGPEFDTGPEGDDFISGGAGNDVLLDWIGSDTLVGELGQDFLFALDDYGSDTPDSLSGGWGEDTVWGDDGDTLSGGGFTDDIVVTLDETDDASVTITDFDAKSETLFLDVDRDAFESATGNDLSMTSDPATGDVALFLAGQKVAHLLAPTGDFTLGNVSLPEWMRLAA